MPYIIQVETTGMKASAEQNDPKAPVTVFEECVTILDKIKFDKKPDVNKFLSNWLHDARHWLRNYDSIRSDLNFQLYEIVEEGNPDIIEEPCGQFSIVL